VLSIPEDEELIAALERRSAGKDVRSLVALHDRKRGIWEVVMRVRGKAEMRRRNAAASRPVR
jgi:hypothetical protein